MSSASHPRRVLAVLAVLAVIAVTLVATVTVSPAALAPSTPAAAPIPLVTWPERPARVTVLGDSIAAGVVAAMAAVAESSGIDLRAFTRLGCGITDGLVVTTNDLAFSTQCASERDTFLNQAAAEPTDAIVVMSSWEVNSHIVDGRLLRFRTPEWDAWMTGELDAIRQRFSGVPMLLATVAPRAPLGAIATMSPSDVDEVLRYNRFVRDYVTMHADQTAIVDVARILCPRAPSACPEYFGEVRPRPDLGAHFDAAGAAWFAPRMADAVQQAWEQVGAVVTAPPGF